MKNASEGVATVVLDTSGGLEVEPGSATVNGAPTSFEMRPVHAVEALGSALVIDIPEEHRSEGAEYTVTVKYKTHPEKCSAVQWLPPEQTAAVSSC